MSQFRYLILVFRDALERPAILAEMKRRTNLEQVYTRDAVTILANDPARVISLSRGAIIGTLFIRQPPSRRVAQSDTKSIDRLEGKDGLDINDDYFGGYLSVSVERDVIRIQCDPSGALPAYHVEGRSCCAVASDAALMHDAGLIDARVDWDALAIHFWSADLPLQKTALAGLLRLSPGTSLVLSPHHQRIEQAWSPWDHVEVQTSLTPQDHADHVEAAVLSAVTAWGSLFRSVLVGVSGGLDSSIVATSLTECDVDLHCLTVAADDPAGDERYYASALCAYLDVNLIERHYSLGDVDPRQSCVAHLPFPSGRTQSLSYNKAVAGAILATGADAFFTGNGGDNLFFLSQSARAIVDRLMCEGPSRKLIGTINDVCALTGCSVFAALRQALEIGTRRRRRYNWKPDKRFLSQQTIAFARSAALDHPWLAAPDKAVHGKAAHIAMLLRLQNHLDGSNRVTEAPVVHPLMSLPVMEACLRVPSWHCCAGGRDRSVARAAFANRLPDLIVRRRTKGGPDGFAAQILSAFLPVIRERLLDGHMASHGIIDVDAIEEALDPTSMERGAAFVPILLLLDAEAWVDGWRSRFCPTP